jgi:DNA modification methylase
MNTNTIYNQDCFELLKSLPDKSVDAIITDPPYMITDLNFDKQGFDVNKFCELSINVLKDDGYFVSFGNIKLLAKFIQFFVLRYSGVWLKTNQVMRTATAKKPMSKSEIYAVFAHPNHKIKNLVFNKLKIYGYKPYQKTQKFSGYKREGKDCLSRINTQGFTKDGYVRSNDGFRYQTVSLKLRIKQQ